MSQRFQSIKLAELRKLASELAAKYAKPPVVIGLTGSLGSGKTTFAKLFAACLGIKNMKSPTFTIVNRSTTAKLNFYHIDLYRLSDYSQIKPLGWEEMIDDPKAVVMIEWADKFPQIKKACDHVINFDFTDNINERNITLKN